MRRMRVSIAGMMAGVLVVGLGLAGLRSYSIWWASGLFTLTLGLVALAAVGATVRVGPQRGADAGYAIFAGWYLLWVFQVGAPVHMVQPPPLLIRAALDQVEGPLFAEARRREAASAKDPKIRYLARDNGWQDSLSNFDESAEVFPRDSSGNNLTDRPPTIVILLEQMNVRRILHCLVANALGLLGAWVGRWLARSRFRETSQCGSPGTATPRS